MRYEIQIFNHPCIFLAKSKIEIFKKKFPSFLVIENLKITSFFNFYLLRGCQRGVGCGKLLCFDCVDYQKKINNTMVPS
jgi:hypothetical protein